MLSQMEKSNRDKQINNCKIYQAAQLSSSKNRNSMPTEESDRETLACCQFTLREDWENHIYIFKDIISFNGF